MMNNTKVATQRLADIKALLEYVKEGISKAVDENRTEQLDSLGSATLTIMTTLRDIQEGIGKSESQLLELHGEITQETFKHLEESLNNLLDNVKENTSNRNDFIEKIVGSYDTYSSNLENLKASIDEGKEREEGVYDRIDEKIGDISTDLQRIDEQIPKEITYQASLKEINNSINRMVESERLNNDRHQEALRKVGEELSKSQDLLSETNIALEEISETYEQSTGRLSVLDMKLDNLTEMMFKGVEGNDVGGRHNE